jgi:uncharacterized protein (DUF1697 family)
MTAMVALLRGVNVGGRSSLPMADLRAAAEACGFEHPRTYIQSGNLVFESSLKPGPAAKKLAGELASTTAVQPEVVVRTRTEMRAVVEKSPYLARGEAEAHLHVVFLADGAKPALPDLTKYAPEEATVVGREVHFFLPNGVGRSKLAADLGRRKDAVGTMRNWRTVLKLIDMLDAD